MGLRLSTQEEKCCTFDSVTDVAFGPVHDTEEEAELFVTWYTESFTGDMRTDWFAGDWRTVMDRYNRWHQVTHGDGKFNQSVAESLIRAEQRN